MAQFIQDQIEIFGKKMENDDCLKSCINKRRRYSGIHFAVIFVGTALAYFAVGKLSLILASLNAATTPFWPASGIALGALLLFGPQLAPAIFLGALLSNLNHGISFWGVLVISLGSTLEALFAFAIAKFLIKREHFKTYSESFTLLSCGFLACIVSASLGVSVLYLNGLVAPGSVNYTWLTWWGGNFVGIVVFAPFILSIFNKNELFKFEKLKNFFELLCYLGILVLLNIQVFKGEWDGGFYWLNGLIFLIATLRLNTLAARILLVFSAFIAISFTYKSYGPFEFGSRNLDLMYLQLVVFTFGAGVLFMGAFKKEKSNLTSFIIMSVGLIMICFGINWISAEAKTYKNMEFQSLVAKAKSNLEKAQNHYSMLLRSSSGLVSLYPELESRAWHKYTENLDLEKNYSAINALCTIQSVERKEISEFLKKIRSHGTPDFDLRDLDSKYAAKFDNIIVVTHIEPIARNMPARGLNLGSEKFRRDAAELSKALNEVVATRPIQLVQDNVKRPGFLIYFPIWTEKEAENPQPQKIFWGWTDAPVISEIFFDNAFKELAKDLNIKLSVDSHSVYELGSFQDSEIMSSNLKFGENFDLFKIKHHLEIYPTEFFIENHKSFPALVGVLLTFLLFLLTAVFSELGSFASKLTRQVKERTAELDQERLKSLQNSKLAALGEMSAGIAHEINNPLTIIAGSIELIPQFLNNPEKLHSKIENIKKSCERIAKIVGALKKFSRSSEAKVFRDVSLEALIAESINLVEHKATRFDTPIAVECNTRAQIYCNDVEIEQVLINLISNSIDAVKDLPVRWIKIKAYNSEQQVVIQVIDSGPGIPKNVMEKLFEPFYTTKKVGEGTGLGLSVSKGILDEHKATIKVLEESPNTCFEIRFQNSQGL